ncbi:MAG TPA: GNAT family N-acetyltransferase [Candidatus Limnocylindrales bacterium]
MTGIRVVPATPDRWKDVVEILGGNGDKGCWCQAPRGFATSWGATPGVRRNLLKQQLGDDPPAGMLAYVDGEVAGWCGFGPRPKLPRLERSRTIPKVDDTPVWAILCFNIRTGFRRRGVATALLDGLIEYARASGAPGLEAYPIDPEGGRVNTSFGYVGLTPWFEARGFRPVVETAATSDRRPRILMRLEFDRRTRPRRTAASGTRTAASRRGR